MTKTPTLEIVPRNRLDEAQRVKDAITQIVEEKVAEAISGPTAAFQPFFQTKRMLTEIRKMQSVPEQNKFVYYYERWGCMVCGTRDQLHGAVGMCGTCYGRIRQRLDAVVRDHSEREETYQDTAELAIAALDPTVNAINVTPNHRKRERFYKQHEAAKAAGIDRKTLWVWLREGEVRPSIQLTPAKSLWTEGDIEQLKLLKRTKVSHQRSTAATARWAKRKENTR